MTEPPDYRPDYKVTTAPRGDVCPVVTLFTKIASKLNGGVVDYGSRHHRCSQPVVTYKPLILNDKATTRLLTTPLVSREEYRRKSGVGKEYAREGSPVVVVTHHALSRAIERVPGIATVDQARALLSGSAIRLAAMFGAHYVRLGTGQHVVIRDSAVITVLPKEARLWRLKYFAREFGGGNAADQEGVIGQS
jgi:hypothetical protein